jgi:hypothetical protein
VQPWRLLLANAGRRRARANGARWYPGRPLVVHGLGGCAQHWPHGTTRAVSMMSGRLRVCGGVVVVGTVWAIVASYFG